jgi:hypothetical protein
MSNDQRLREELGRRAEAAGDDYAASYTAVRRRGRRAVLRTRIAAAGVTVAAVMAIVLVGPRLAGMRTQVAPATVGPPPSVSAPTADSRLSGYYTLFLASKKPAVRRYEIGGTWVANIYADGHLTLLAPVRQCCNVDSPFRVEGHRIVVQDAVADYDHCSGPGVYRWSLADGRLRFRLVRDDCLVRSLLFSETWTREGPPAPAASSGP